MSPRALLLVLFLALPIGASASALPDAVREQLRLSSGPAAEEPRSLGSGEMSWFGLSIYQASLWSAAERFDGSAPFALVLRYSRDIAGSRLVSSSIDELKRLGTRDEATLKRWEALLEGVFPDVKSGDSIIGVSLPSRGALFYHQGRLTGEIVDQAFARAFFAIWLDERTRAPDLRARLLGGP